MKSYNLKKAVSCYFPSSDIIRISPFTSGNINKMYEVKLKKRNIILRIYNEAWKAKKEALIYKKIKDKLNLPVPEVYYYDDSCTMLPKAFSLLSKLPGYPITYSYRKYHNLKLFEKAGASLAKIHTIKYAKFGWILGDEIKPSFKKWSDFVEYDLYQKIEKQKEIQELRKKIENYLSDNENLLKIAQKPCMLHKDYHGSHILTDAHNITGILDMEWAIAGHNENDFIKMELWTIGDNKKIKQTFFKGYKEWGNISEDYEKRKRIYELWHYVNMVNISSELKNKKWLKYNIHNLQRFILHRLHLFNHMA